MLAYNVEDLKEAKTYLAMATSDADAWTENAAIAHGEEMLAKLEQALSKE